MTGEEAKGVLKMWGKIIVGLAFISSLLFMFDKCESTSSIGSSIEYENDDFDMQSVQKE
jgi:hypothetical protein